MFLSCALRYVLGCSSARSGLFMLSSTSFLFEVPTTIFLFKSGVVSRFTILNSILNVQRQQCLEVLTTQTELREMDGNHDIDDAVGKVEYLVLGACQTSCTLRDPYRGALPGGTHSQEKIEPCPSRTRRDVVKPGRLPPCGVFFLMSSHTGCVASHSFLYSCDNEIGRQRGQRRLTESSVQDDATPIPMGTRIPEARVGLENARKRPWEDNNELHLKACAREISKRFPEARKTECVMKARKAPAREQLWNFYDHQDAFRLLVRGAARIGRSPVLRERCLQLGAFVPLQSGSSSDLHGGAHCDSHVRES